MNPETSPRRSLPVEGLTSDHVLDAFLQFVSDLKLELYPAQEEAILALLEGKNVILNTPTGSGKSLVAVALHFASIVSKRRSVYTSPVKALVNERFLALCGIFGAENVGLVTGDGSVNSHAPILCCTAEILSQRALREGSSLEFQDLILDEFHYYTDKERGMVWQLPLLICSKARFLLMSATLGNPEFFAEKLTELTQKETAVVIGVDRPVPLHFEYSEKPLHETLGKLLDYGRAPIYLVHFTQRECAEEAQNLLSVNLCTKEEKKVLSQLLEGFRFSSPYGKEIQKLLKHGVGIHHGALLPKYRILVEKLAQKGVLKVICGTDTLGVGVNVPIRTVVLTSLSKYNGEKTALLSVRDFQQICGRAGRRGFDTEGHVVVQAPAHVIENLQLEQKASGDPKKIKKIVKKKPPERFFPWNRESFTKLVEGTPEPLSSQFKMDHSILLNILSRSPEVDADPCESLRALIRVSHESDTKKKQHRRQAFKLFRSLVERQIIQLSPLTVNLSLQEDFSLHQSLSLYLIDAIAILDVKSQDYALDLLTLVESILENPELILRRQLDVIKTKRMEELKQEGMPYEERILELEKCEYPKPKRDLIYETFNAFLAHHPWVGEENIRPKSIAREMYELFYSFSDYIREYQLQRAEGLLLRYLSDVYKTLVQGVPQQVKNEELENIIFYFREMLSHVDESLLEEWQKIQGVTSGSSQTSSSEAQEPARNPVPILRNEVFRRVTYFARDQMTELHQSLTMGEKKWEIRELEDLKKQYLDEDHLMILMTPKARALENCRVKKSDSGYHIEQILVDPEGHCDWAMEFEIQEKNQEFLFFLLKIGSI